MDIFERMKNGELIRFDDPEYQKVQEQIDWVFTKTSELNKLPYNKPLVRAKVGELLGIEIDETTTVCLPFYTDWGMFVTIGKDVFINMGVRLWIEGELRLRIRY